MLWKSCGDERRSLVGAPRPESRGDSKSDHALGENVFGDGVECAVVRVVARSCGRTSAAPAGSVHTDFGSKVAARWSLFFASEREVIIAQVARQRIEDRVYFLGHRFDMTFLLPQAAMFILTSPFKGIPNTLLKAMAQEALAAVVTYASLGPLEELDHGQSGCVVSNEVLGALAEGLKQLASDSSKHQQFGAAARDQLLSHDWSQLTPVWDGVSGGI